MNVNKILDGLFIINSFIVYSLILVLGLSFLGFVKINENIVIATAIITLCYLIEGLLADRRSKKQEG